MVIIKKVIIVVAGIIIIIVNLLLIKPSETFLYSLKIVIVILNYKTYGLEDLF